MGATTSATLAKMRALREAKRLGCSGAHQTEDGQWHPCSSAESLRSISPEKLLAKPNIVLPPMRRRDQVGTAKIKKQWENLGQRGIVSIDTISGGGLVSGSIGKELLSGPRDNDPDTFTDIESARARSRQLGCIGVSRRTTLSGRTVWMPCTNMTDLANRTGRTALGRRNMERQAQRFITDAFKKRDREISKAKVRRKSLLDDLHGIPNKQNTPSRVRTFVDIQTKGLGPRIGRGLRSAPSGMTFVDITGAIDADKDGIVFEGKPLERPIIPKFVLPDGIARRVQRLIQGTAEQNEKTRRLSGNDSLGEIDANQLASIVGIQPTLVESTQSDPLLDQLRQIASRSSQRNPAGSSIAFDDELPPVNAGREFDTQARRVGKKLATKTFAKIDDIGSEYENLTNDEIAQLAMTIIPSNTDDLKRVIKANPYTRKNWKRVLQRIEAAKPDWNAQKIAQQQLYEDLSRDPLLQHMVRKYGMPPIVATEYQPDISNLGGLSYTLGPSQWGETIGGWSGAGFIGINSRILPEQIGDRPTYFMYRDVDSSRTIRHELAHAWETMAAKQGGPAREHYIQQYQEISEGLLDIKDKDEDDFGTTYHDAPWGTDAEHRAALLISGYAETARIEWFAETIAAMTDPSGAEQRKVNSLSLQNAAAVLGMPTSDLIAVSRGSMRSHILSGRSSKSPRTPVNKFIGLPNNDIEDALSFLRSNPEYIEDAPDELLARLDDGDFQKSIRDYASSLRSSRTLDSDILQAPQKAEESRRKGELGQTIIDYLMNQASGPNSSSEQPTLWFIGGTTGSGKTTLRTAGVFDGVPTPSQAVDIDPDVIKSMHPDWDNGNGAQKIHRWSTQWTRYGLRQAMAQQRDTVITGTGVRTDQLTTAKRNGYLTVGHFVYVPTDRAVKNMRQRAKSGGTNLPDYFAERYASELEYKITSAIRSGDLDEFYLWDNSTDTPKLAARRTRDGRYDIFNRSVFESFLGKQGARQVEDHWARNASTASSNYSIDDSISSRSSRSLSKLVPRRDVIMTRGSEQLKVSDRDISKIDTRHSMLEGVVIGSGADISKFDWFSSTWRRVKAENLNIGNPLVVEESSLTDVSFSGLNAPVGSSFSYTTLKSVDFSKSKLDGADFSNSDLSNVDFTSTSLVGAKFKGAVLRSVDFSGADLSQSDLTPDDIKGSGIVWSTSTKFSPEITEFLLTQKIKKSPGGKFILDNRTSTSSVYNRAADTYGASRRIRRSNINGLPRGPRTALHEARTPGSDKLLIQNKTLDGIDVSHFNLGNLEISDTVISRPRMREMRAIDAKFDSVQILHADGERLSLVRATFINTSIRDSDLHRSNFNGSTVIGQLNLSGSNLSGATLRGIRFGNGSINGLIDVRGCDLSDADLDGIDLRRLKWDTRTNWSGVKLPHIPSRLIPPDLRGKVISGRSTRALSHSEMLSSINNINDAWIDFSKLSSADKNEEAQNLLSSYRSIFNTIDEIDSIESSIASMLAQKDIALKQLEPFQNQNLPNGEIIDLLSAIEKGDRSSFADRFTKLQLADSNSFKNESMLDVWKRGSDLVSMRDSVDMDINELKIQHNDFKRAAGTANTLDLIANSDLGEIKKYPGVNPNLPDGKRVGPVSARSTIRELPLNSPKYIDDLFNDPLLKEALETFPDINEDEQLLKSRFQEFSYEFNSQLQELLDGKYDNIPAHPLAGTSLRDAINNTRIIIYSDGTHSIVAPQNTLLSNMLPDRRDWSTIELPDKETIQKTTNILNASGGEYQPGGYSADDITAMSNSVAEKLIDHISEQLATIDKQEKPASFMKGMTPYLMNYLRVLNNPHDWLNGMDPESVDGPAAILALHDGFGHFAIGRGFDRHGEWAVTMAMLSLVRDNAVDLLEDERQVYGREVLARFGTPWLAKRLTNSEELANVNKLKKAIYYYDGDIFDVIDSLDPRDVGSQAVLSSRSARRNEYAILTPEKLREVSRIEARDKLLQELRNKRKDIRDKKSPRVQQRQMRRDARRRRARNASEMSSRSQRFMDVVAGEELQTPPGADYLPPRGNARRNSVNQVKSGLQLIAADLKNGSLYDIPIHPELDSRRRELVDSITIEFDEKGLAMVMADPHPIFSQLLARKRDWRTIRLPGSEEMKALDDIVRESPKRTPRKASGTDDDFISEPIDDQIYELINSLLTDFFGDDWQDQRPVAFHDVQPELGGLKTQSLTTFAGMWYAHLKYPQVNPLGNTQDYIHDLLGHIGTGRGFDRHGEWANAVAFLDFILYSPLLDADDKQRNDFAKRWFRNYGLQHLQRSYFLEDTEFAVDRPTWTFTWQDYGQAITALDPKDVDMKRVLDALAPLDSPTISSRSSRSMKFADATSSELNQIAEDEVRAMRFRSGARSSTKRPMQTPSRDTLSPFGKGLQDAETIVSSDVIRRTKPRLKVDSDGILTIDSSNMALSDISTFDIAQITESDLPKNFNPQMPSSMRVLVARTELLRWKERNVVEVNDDGTISGKRLYDNNPKYGSTAIFKQDLISRLSDGHSVIVRDLPSDYHTGATKMAVVTKVGSTLVAFELDDNEISDIETGLKQLRSNMGGPIGLHSAPSGNFDGTEIFDISQIHKMLPSTSEGSLKDRLDAVIDFQAQLSGIDGDLPKPSILMKKQSYYGLVSLPPEVMEQYGGREAVSKKISGIAFADDNSFVMYNSGTKVLNPSTMVHEWAHVADKTRGKNGGLVSTSELWSEAANLDREFGQDLIGTDKALSLAVSEYRLKPPMIQSGQNVRQISPNLSPRIGMVGVTQYGDVSPTEDFAEASKLFILDKTYGYVAQEVDFDGRPIPGGRQWTFAELYPNRAKQLERIYFGTSQGDPTQISSRSSRKFDSRFKSSYGHNVPQGDGDCFVSAVEGIDRLTSSEFNIDPSQIRIVHGIPMGTGGEAEGMRFPHAWIEVLPYDQAEHEQMIQEIEQLMKSIAEEISVETKQRMTQRLNDLRKQIFENEMSTTVYDFSNGNEAIVPAAIYYAIGKINKEDNRYYSRDAADEMMAINGHYGPWD